MRNGRPNSARQFAGVILLVLMIASGAAAAVALAGRSGLSLQICGGALVIAFLILVLGGLAVGSSPDGGENTE
ncbi:MAG: hypothetical protein ACOCX3_02470 [Chloroflexota bacterium]